MSNEELLSSVLNEGVHDYHIPERVLMLCVILQQLLDATKPTYEGENSYNILLRDTRKLFADGSELKFVRKRINAILHETRT